MSASASIEILSAFKDARGSLFEPLDDATLARQRNVHVVITAPGAVRGNHFHTASTEVTAVVGPALVRLKEGINVRASCMPIKISATAVWCWCLLAPPCMTPPSPIPIGKSFCNKVG
jgi:hypothetical protein